MSLVKQIENAAFSQEVNDVGPVVETEYGFHIIQVLERHTPKALALDDRMKGNISTFLEQQKQQERPVQLYPYPVYAAYIRR